MKHYCFAIVISFLAAPLLWAQETLEGTWTAQRSDGGFWISVSTDKFGWYRSTTLKLADLPSGEIDLALDREPGVISLEGSRRGDRAAGFFTFRPKPEFNERLERLGYGAFDFEELYLLTTLDATVAEVSRVRDLGYTDLTTDELLSMHIHGALSGHIEAMKQLGYDNLSVDDLLSTRIHDVTPEFVKAIRGLGLVVESLDQLVTMRIHDVTPEYVESIRELGYVDATVDDLIEMRIHDITPDYVKAVNERLDGERLRPNHPESSPD